MGGFRLIACGPAAGYKMKRARSVPQPGELTIVMLAEERRFRIREMLTTQRTINASDLCSTLEVTPATIRRDLAALEDEGVLVRSHGGAVSRMSSTKFQPSYHTLARSNSEEKRAIAREAEKLILDGDTVFLEGSTTVLELAARLDNRHRPSRRANTPNIRRQLAKSKGVSVLVSRGGTTTRNRVLLARRC